MQKTSSQYLKEMENIVRTLDAMRSNGNKAVDITLSEYVQGRWGVTLAAFYEDLGVEPNMDTIHNLVSMPDKNYRWLIPELIRDAVRLGLRKQPIYPDLIAGEQAVAQTSITMPAINMADATPKKLGVAETIPLGDISFQEKSVKINKIGRGIKIPYEVIQYVSLNLVAIFLQDAGVKTSMAIDWLALNTLFNGDQADGSDSIATIGVATAGTVVFRDLLKPWMRLARMGKRPTTMVAGEDMAMDMLDLFTYNNRLDGTPRINFNLKTPLPQNADMHVHGFMAANKVLMVDKASAMIKLNAQPLLIESERIVSNQTEATYYSLTTGFATIFKDSRIALDKSLVFGAGGLYAFPEYMDPTQFEVVPLTKK